MTKKLEEMLDRIINKIDGQGVHLSSIDITLAKQSKDLEYHIARTDLLQDKQEDNLVKTQANTEHRIKLMGFIKISVGLLTASGAILGIVYTILNLI